MKAGIVNTHVPATASDHFFAFLGKILLDVCTMSMRLNGGNGLSLIASLSSFLAIFLRFRCKLRLSEGGVVCCLLYW